LRSCELHDHRVEARLSPGLAKLFFITPSRDRVPVFSRRCNDYTDRVPAIAGALAAMSAIGTKPT
jgi:hypothetical protein